MFRYTEQYKDIKKEFSLSLDSLFSFSSFNDGIFVFSLELDEILHEFRFICDDTLIGFMSVKDLLHLKRMEYFAHNVYLKDDDVWLLENSIVWNIKDELSGSNNCN